MIVKGRYNPALFLVSMNTRSQKNSHETHENTRNFIDSKIKMVYIVGKT